MPVPPRWTVAAFLAAGTLGLVAAAWLVLAHDSGRLTYAVPPGQA